MFKLKLSILDQSPILQGTTASQALLKTIELAKEADKLGFSRFWVSEHHDAPGLAGSSPEVLISAIAAHTQSIRIGSGGVMLPHYSPYKVAENFRVLEGLYPNRIDLGMGRAPGGMPLATRALRYGRLPNPGDPFPEMLREAAAFLSNGLITTEDRPFGSLTATPVVETVPQMWLLGSSNYSGRRAAELGAGFAFAHFINGEEGRDVVGRYYANYCPGPLGTESKAIVCVIAVYADTEEEAERQAKCIDLRLLRFENGDFHSEFPTPEEAERYPYSEIEQNRVRYNRSRMIVGGQDRMGERLLTFAESYGVDELMLLVMAQDYDIRFNAYQRLAQYMTDKGTNHLEKIT
ncbi:MAG: LLM class flavin-dependent oxidoreductase [Gorillibacterium sp.]|nr:LLM class flavin-dependent oxidoreductase [Gorillibacterium sp.]